MGRWQADMEEALRESWERFESVFEYAAIGMGLVSPDGRWLRVNRALCEVLGYTKAELRGEAFQAVTHADDLNIDLDRFERLLSGESSSYRAEKRYCRKDGQIVWGLVSLSAVHGEYGEVLYLIFQVQDITERKALEEKLVHLAYHDSLTGLPNRALLEERIDIALKRSKRTGSPVALLYLDLDGFKAVNDSLGHDAGDLLLIELARRIELYSRPTDTVARLGGDEFCILLEDFREPKEAERVAARLKERMAVPFRVHGTAVQVGASIGIASRGARNGACTAKHLLYEADAEMYRSKKAKRARRREGANQNGSVATGSRI